MPKAPAAIGEITFFSELMDNPSFVARAPCCYPMAPESQSALLEREISIGRFVDMASVAGDFNWRGEQGRIVVERAKDAVLVSATAGVT
ncbi:MAG TPA: hypothetical protein VIJ34_12890, partial [Acidimicrobiales bacterium]